LLLNRFRAGRDQIALGAKKPRRRIIVAAQSKQRDFPSPPFECCDGSPSAACAVSQLTATSRSAATIFPLHVGSWPTDQEFAALAREVLDVQRYPDLRQYPAGPPERPYDAGGLVGCRCRMGVHVVAVTSPLGEDVRGKLNSPARCPEYENQADPL